MTDRYRLRKIKAIAMVTGGDIGCQECGFSAVRALQFDHIVPIGDRLSRHAGMGPERGGAIMIGAILNGKQDVSVLRVLCANCHCLKDEK